MAVTADSATPVSQSCISSGSCLGRAERRLVLGKVPSLSKAGSFPVFWDVRSLRPGPRTYQSVGCLVRPPASSVRGIVEKGPRLGTSTLWRCVPAGDASTGRSLCRGLHLPESFDLSRAGSGSSLCLLDSFFDRQRLVCLVSLFSLGLLDQGVFHHLPPFLPFLGALSSFAFCFLCANFFIRFFLSGES